MNEKIIIGVGIGLTVASVVTKSVDSGETLPALIGGIAFTSFLLLLNSIGLGKVATGMAYLAVIGFALNDGLTAMNALTRIIQ